MRAATLALILLLTLLPGGGWSQAAPPVKPWTGVVRNQAGLPLVGALVSAFKDNWTGKPVATAASQRDGAFTLNGLTPGRYILNVVKAGYEPLSFAMLAPSRDNPVVVVLRNLAQNNTDRKNWDLNTVLRTSTDRNLIFRNKTQDRPAETPRPPRSGVNMTAVRSGNLQLTAIQPLASMPLGNSQPSLAPGLSTQFAYIEPVSGSSSFVVTGTLTTGQDRQYRIRNTMNFNISKGHKLQVNMGVDRIEGPRPSASKQGQGAALETQILSTIQPLENINLGIQDYFRIAEPLTLVYGFDLNINPTGGRDATVVLPRFQLYLNPAADVNFKFGVNTQRVTRDSQLRLAEGQVANLAPPVGLNPETCSFANRITHLETGLSFLLGSKTTLEVSSFLEEVAGSGFPFVVILKSPENSMLAFPQVPDRLNDSRGFRLSLSHRISNRVNTSILYVYSSGLEYATRPNPADLSAGLSQRFFRTLSTSLQANIPGAGTDITATYRHSSGNSLTPLDPYSNYYDTGDKSLSLFIRQPLPLFGKSHTKWEAIMDIRNILNQGVKAYETTTGDLILVRSARSVRGGINFRF